MENSGSARLMKVAEVAELLAVRTDTVYALLASAKLQSHRIGVGRGTIRISQDQLDEFLAASVTKARSAPTPAHRPALVKNQFFRHC